MVRKQKSSKHAEKHRAWEAFAKYIKLRDCLRTTRTHELGRCISCGKVMQVRDGDKWLPGAHAGHFVPGRSAAILFHPRQVHLQCAACNIYRRGNWPAYYESLQKRWGEKEVTRLVAMRREIVKCTDYPAITEKYSRRFARLEKLLWRGKWQRQC